MPKKHRFDAVFGVPTVGPNPDTNVLKTRRGSRYTSGAFGAAARSQRANGDADDHAIRESFFSIHEAELIDRRRF